MGEKWISHMSIQRKPVIYLTNKDLRAELEKSLAQGKMTEEMGRMFIQLVDNIAKKSCYASYTYLDEMKGTAILTLCKGWYKFDLKYSNCFAYYTSFVKNAFNHVLRVEKKEQRGRDSIMVDNGLNPSFGFSEEDYENVRGFSIGGDRDETIDGVPLPKYDEISDIDSEKDISEEHDENQTLICEERID